MRFRPCIDIHDGRVKQIVGGTLSDSYGAETNFISEQGAAFYGRLYRNLKLAGGHIILLNKPGTPEYNSDVRAASEAMQEFPDGFMIGGGVNAENAPEYLKLGASHVIVTSYVFRDGRIDYERLEELVKAVGREHLVLDLSCRRKVSFRVDEENGMDQAVTEDELYIVTDRWQKYTTTPLNLETLEKLKAYASEYLIHGVDVEGKRSGIDRDILKLLGSWEEGIPVTYAGGVSNFLDLETVRKLGNDKVDVTIGSALDIFGGEMELSRVVQMCS